jgi:hypothetical protein
MNLASGRRGRRFKSGHPDPGHRPLSIFAGGLSRAMSDYDCVSAPGKMRSMAPAPRPGRAGSACVDGLGRGGATVADRPGDVLDWDACVGHQRDEAVA